MTSTDDTGATEDGAHAPDTEAEVLPRNPDAVVQASARAVRRPRGSVGYAVYGDSDGDPVVFAHPAPGTRAFGRMLADEAAELGVCLVVPERPGYGRSDSHTLVGPFTASVGVGDVTSQVGGIPRVLDELGVEEFGLLGFSSGCPFALALATEHPDRVEGLVLVSATTPGDRGDDVPVRSATREIAPEEDAGDAPSDRTRAALSRRLRNWSNPLVWLQHRLGQLSDREVASLYGDPDRVEGVAPTLRRDLSAAISEPMTGYATERHLLSGEWGVDLSAVDARPVLIHGAEDQHAPSDAGRTLGSLVGGADLGVVEGEGHLSALLSTGETTLRHAAPSVPVVDGPGTQR